MPLSLVTCSICNNEFFKDNRHVNENKKLGHKFYCSSNCQSLGKNKQLKIICENPSCRKIFKKTHSQITFRNFCSRSCAATINNLGKTRNRIGFNGFYKRESSLRQVLPKYCEYCGNRRIYGRKYCSKKCWAKNNALSKEDLVTNIKLLSIKLGRSPTRRECRHSTACMKYFGSWNNALIAAGLTPYRSLNQKMYKRRLCIAVDSHKCNSVSELIIDNWLYKNKISHQKETSYPKGKFTADWSLSANVFAEYFGLANDSRRYDQEIQKKRQICQEFNIRLIEIYSKDLFPKNLLEQIFK